MTINAISFVTLLLSFDEIEDKISQAFFCKETKLLVGQNKLKTMPRANILPFYATFDVVFLPVAENIDFRRKMFYGYTPLFSQSNLCKSLI